MNPPLGLLVVLGRGDINEGLKKFYASIPAGQQPMKPSFHTPLKLEYLDGRNYRLIEMFQYDSSVGTFTVPAGFITDFASIPEFMWNILPPTGQYGKAAVVHDFLYRTPDQASKEIADAIFLEAMQALGTPWLTRYAMYLAVRLFGGPAYKGGL